MSEEENAKYLDQFPIWLRNLGHEADDIAKLLTVEGMSQDAREAIAGGINYLFKSLDLIPDGIDNIGYLDDAFVLRVCADLACREDLGEATDEQAETLRRLSDECDLVREFLGEIYPRLETLCVGQRHGSAKGRAVSDVVSDEEICKDLISDVTGFAKSYESPGFTREEKNLLMLKAFFNEKLPH